MAEEEEESKMKKKKVEIFDTEEELAVSLARKLKEPPYVCSLDWSKWHVFWLDERVVPKSHPDSNYKLAFDGFLSYVPIPVENVYAINDALPAEGAAEDYENCVRQLVTKKVMPLSTITGFPAFDLMLLGMGPDGHVASLFPGHPLLNENERWVTYIKDSPKPPPERITFTFPVINSSKYLAVVVAGLGEVEAVRKVLGSGDGDGHDSRLPAGMVSAEGELTWFLDKDAASKL
ncbi:hypothetical protein MLD38_019902 [Melastoma candidum]|uniref:Uncharacterized protein n=1 Tax=Melastoma candidum TaxID=119954 RepID=A0ACB9QAW0_9MYRT|nr:hypothetical protein MLD38_019902 [Melastoma candidum]